MANDRNAREAAVRAKIVELAEASIWHKPPFDVFEYQSMADKYMPYIREYPSEQQELFIQAMVRLKRASLDKDLPRDIQAYDLLEPIRKKIDEKFLKTWDPSKLKPRASDVTFKLVKHLVIQSMKDEMPEYKYEKLSENMHDPAIITFTKAFSSDSKFMVRFDRGTNVPHSLTPSVGVINPWYEVDVDELLGKKERIFSSRAECEKTILETVRIVKRLAPIFEEKVREALVSSLKAHKMRFSL